MTNLHRALAVLLMAPALMVPSAGATAQPPVDAPPAEVCLTNACAEPLKETGKARTVREAIGNGDALAVRDLGGTPQDVVAALIEKVEIDFVRKGDASESGQRWLTRERADYQHFADPGFGAFAFAPPSFVGTRSGPPMRGPNGAPLEVEFVLQRRSRTGCMELIIVHDDGSSVPTDTLCKP